jgi:hypothetical protein
MIKNRNIFPRILVSLFMSLTICTIWFFSETPYEAGIVLKRQFHVDNQVFYFDLNNNGIAEQIVQKMTSPGQMSVLVNDEMRNVIEQYNLRGRRLRISTIFDGDYDSNSLRELYCFTHTGDSLFLNIIDPLGEDSEIVKRRYIDGCRALDGEAMYRIDGSAMEDVNGDGFKEFYFAISAGFTLFPRSLYYYDQVNDILRASPPAGSGPRHELKYADIDGDGFLEFWGYSNSVDNHDTVVPYRDNSTWLMIYSHELGYEFEPVEFPGNYTTTITRAVTEDGRTNFIILKSYGGNSDTLGSELFKFNAKGEKLYRFDLKDYGICKFMNLYTNENNCYIHSYSGRVLKFNEKLELQRSVFRDWMRGTSTRDLSLNKSNMRLFLIIHPDGSLNFVSTQFRLLASLQIDDISTVFYTPVAAGIEENENGIFLKTTNFDYLISFSRNHARMLIILWSVLISIGFYLFILLVQELRLRQERKRIETENKLRDLQITSIRNQMNPHFIFNALNSISAMYIKGDTMRADSFLTSFSRLIREVVDSSDKIIVTVKQEIVFVSNYLDLEKTRIGDNFSYKIDISEKCLNVRIPFMTIHTFVENSVKHAFPDKERDILIEITGKCNKNHAWIEIRDNGIGFADRDPGKPGNGKGLSMVKDIFRVYKDITSRKISFSILPLAGNGSKIIINIEL